VRLMLWTERKLKSTTIYGLQVIDTAWHNANLTDCDPETQEKIRLLVNTKTE